MYIYPLQPTKQTQNSNPTQNLLRLLYFPAPSYLMDWIRGRTLGRGSSATVSLASAVQSGEAFAVKSIQLSRSECLKREQRILSCIGCSQVVGYKGCDVTSENGQLVYNLFMEYVPGGTLTDAIQKQGGQLDESAIRSHCREILRGLHYLHTNGIVHCDIKGRNVLIGKDGAKIADLGCARWVDEVTPFAGTPVFMAPEVARGDEQGIPADVWSVGCTVIEMATGRPPWPEVADPVSALYRIAFSKDTPELPNCLSEQARDFLSKCLMRNPKERWTTAQLLKHPFLGESNSHFKQIQGADSDSPTSILDQGFWDSLEESETHINFNSLNSPAERIRRLCGGISSSSPRLPDWTWDENWVTVRSSTNNSNDGEEEEGNSLRREQNMIPADEPTTSGGPFTVEISKEEGLNFNGSLVVNGDSLNYSVNDSCCRVVSGRRGSVQACKCNKVNVLSRSNLNYERHKNNSFSLYSQFSLEMK
ncbi:PREDICTED: mitogen-activated protein kinase kinase kinase 2-like [Nelumbo nucifera]|uniref:mitogen-activated protein kinase kinase kinase n=1 Tax=Nelumbo nucifera TaxID=4432 RepID=A0A1U7ZU32_NELNU|nr:PREDICTED: mitogen-activated protein kinase kinase kinase 2-like [Nelumbo nucifera]